MLIFNSSHAACRFFLDLRQLIVCYRIRNQNIPGKTKILYCKDDNRRGNYPNEKFDFLGYEFRPRSAKNRFGKCFVNFSPAIRPKAAKEIRREIRSWKIHRMSDKSIEDLSRIFNPVIRD